MSDSAAPESARLFVGGVPSGVTAAQVEHMFGRVPGVKRAQVDPLRPVGCPGPTYTFVDISAESEAGVRKCVSIFNNSSWKGGKLKVERSKPRFDIRLQAERESARKRAAFEASWKKERIEKWEEKRRERIMNPRDLRIRGPRGKGVFHITTATMPERLAKLTNDKKTLKHGSYVCEFPEFETRPLDDLAVHHTKAAKRAKRLRVAEAMAEEAAAQDAEMAETDQTNETSNAATRAPVQEPVSTRPQPGAVRGRNARHADQEKALAGLQESGIPGAADWMFDDEDGSESKKRSSSGRVASEFDAGIDRNDKNRPEEVVSGAGAGELIEMQDAKTLTAENDNALALLDSMLGGGGGGGGGGGKGADDTDNDAKDGGRGDEESNARPASRRRAPVAWAVVEQYDPTSETAAELEVKEPEPKDESENESVSDEDESSQAAKQKSSALPPPEQEKEESATGGGFKFGFMSAPVVDADGVDGTNENTTLQSIFRSSFNKKEEEDAQVFRFGDAAAADTDGAAISVGGVGGDTTGAMDVVADEDLTTTDLEDMPTFAEVMVALKARWQNVWGSACVGSSFVRKGGKDNEQGENAERAWLEQRSELTQDFRRKRKVALKQGLGSKRGRRGGGGGGGRRGMTAH